MTVFFYISLRRPKANLRLILKTMAIFFLSFDCCLLFCWWPPCSSGEQEARRKAAQFPLSWLLCHALGGSFPGNEGPYPFRKPCCGRLRGEGWMWAADGLPRSSIWGWKAAQGWCRSHGRKEGAQLGLVLLLQGLAPSGQGSQQAVGAGQTQRKWPALTDPFHRRQCAFFFLFVFLSSLIS